MRFRHHRIQRRIIDNFPKQNGVVGIHEAAWLNTILSCSRTLASRRSPAFMCLPSCSSSMICVPHATVSQRRLYHSQVCNRA
jgi:hypothetical protein